MSTDHPGIIVFEDRDEQTRREAKVSEVPEHIAWVEVDGERIAVTRIETQWKGRERVIRAYGADGTLLATTTQAPR